MSFTNRINVNTDFNNKDISSLPDIPTMGASDLKARFDANAKQVITPKYNGLIDELESSSAASNIGATAPVGRSGNSVQAVLTNISASLDTVESEAHEHSNKTNCLDYLSDNNGQLNYRDQPISGGGGSYTAGNGISISSNTISARLDSETMEFSSGNIKAKNSHTHDNKSLLDDYTQTEADIKQAVEDSHTHSNKTYIDKIGEDSQGKITYDGQPIGSSDVSWNQIVTTGTKIATIGINGNSTDVYAPTSGTEPTASTLSGLSDVSLSTLSNNQALKYDSTTSKWKNSTLGISDINNLSTELGKRFSTDAGTVSTAADTDIVPIYASSNIKKISIANLKTLMQAGLTDIFSALGHHHNVSDIDDFPTIPTVSQSYDGTSANAMSGTAVKQAIDTRSPLSHSHDLKDLGADSTHRLVADTDISNWNSKVDSVSVSRSGSASSSVASVQQISVVDAGSGSPTLYDIDGTKYLEASGTGTTYTFNNGIITSNAVYDIYSTVWGDNPTQVTVEGGTNSMEIKFGTSTPRSVRVYIK